MIETPTGALSITMRFFLLSLLVALLAAYVSAVVSQRPVLVTYEANTPQSLIDKAMDAIRNAGGVVTHEFSMKQIVSLDRDTRLTES